MRKTMFLLSMVFLLTGTCLAEVSLMNTNKKIKDYRLHMYWDILVCNNTEHHLYLKGNGIDGGRGSFQMNKNSNVIVVQPGQEKKLEDGFFWFVNLKFIKESGIPKYPKIKIEPMMDNYEEFANRIKVIDEQSDYSNWKALMTWDNEKITHKEKHEENEYLIEIIPDEENQKIIITIQLYEEEKIYVTNSLGTGLGSLRWAVDNVSDGGIICFDTPHYNCSVKEPIEVSGKSITIDGKLPNGSNVSFLPVVNEVPVEIFKISSDATLNLSNMKFSRFDTNTIINKGKLSLDSCEFTGSSTDGDCSAI